MPILYIVLGALAAVLGMLVYFQNPQPIELTFFGYSLQAPLSLLLTASAVLGLVLGYLMAMPGRAHAAWVAHRQAREIRDRDRTIAGVQRRIAELERDLAAAKQPSAATIEETRAPSPGADIGVRRVA